MANRIEDRITNGQRRLLKHETTPLKELESTPRDELVAYVAWLEAQHVDLSKAIVELRAEGTGE